MNTVVCALCEAIRWAPCSAVCRIETQSPVAKDRLRSGEQDSVTT